MERELLPLEGDLRRQEVHPDADSISFRELVVDEPVDDRGFSDAENEVRCDDLHFCLPDIAEECDLERNFLLLHSSCFLFVYTLLMIFLLRFFVFVVLVVIANSLFFLFGDSFFMGFEEGVLSFLRHAIKNKYNK